MRTQYENLRTARAWQECVVDVLPVEPYNEGGLIERLPLFRNTHKGTLRSAWQVLPLLSRTDYDALLTQVALPLVPLLAASASRGKPLPAIAYTIDTTPALMDGFHEIYYGTPPADTFKRALRDRLHRYVFSHCVAIVPWSRWAADSFVRDYGVSEKRISVIPPGLNLSEWVGPQPHLVESRGQVSRRFRLLFVGADFERKGGRLLLDVFRERFQDCCELDVVTREAVSNEPGVRVHRDLGPKDSALRDLYRQSDALILPTRADCFSLASIEAMACALPVVACSVGGIPEIVANGSTGLLVAPNDGRALAQAIHALEADRSRSVAMGLTGRRVVESRFNSEKNARALITLLR